MESLLELIVLGELAQEAWFGRRQLIDVGRPVVDAFGYDVTLRCNGVLRHVQFKSRRIDGKAASYKISTRLAECPSGCVVWLGWSPKADTHRVDIAHRWFGGAPGDPLPDLGSTIAKHTKANSAGMKIERPDQRVVPLRRFERIANTSVLLDHLFGAPTR